MSSAPSPPPLPYISRRSNVYSTGGMVASSQPLASQIGRDILLRGGNAADAAVAVAAALGVTEPTSTGIGGDAFVLYYDAATRKVSGLNASGRAAALLTRDAAVASLKLDPASPVPASLPATNANAVTVPGAAAGWVDAVALFGSGRLSLADILAPAIRLAEDGYPVSELTAFFWGRSEARILAASPNGKEILRNGKAPKAGEIIKLTNMGKTFRLLAEHGKKGFYEGAVAQSIVETLNSLGSVLSLDDLKSHTSTPVTPISIVYDNALRVHECPPNGQGITALMALGILDSFKAVNSSPDADFIAAGHNSVPYLHIIIEALRLAFADTRHFVTDPERVYVPVDGMLSKEYLTDRAKLINTARAGSDITHGSPENSSDTVYFSVVDKDGNACSFINSNYEGFGSAIVPKGFGFVLQNRGSNFSLDPNHPNVLAPNKRPYHTIIPAIVTHAHDESLHMCYGVMGGFMQPQGHTQVLLNMHHFGMTPQQALDASRIQVMPDIGGVSIVEIEEGIGADVIEGLKKLGHVVKFVSGQARASFGRGQVILVRRDESEDGKKTVLVGGCDPRSDGIVAAAQ
ncbi:hypothetical protein HK100_001435 [Physocladia obscura]|uniref:Gamma-glutamyltranspeptidase n=1 Tax=Physocladia obscura TaxID=109957 RepID=A0AAD5T7T2_9FUNG|nr:hypothetical protein HK100_001435 [Physocladia obscura]